MYRKAVDQINIGVSLISPDMRILALNRQMREWFPDVDADAKPVCFKSFNRPARDEVCSYCPTALTLKDGRVHESITATPAGDRIIHYRIVATPILDDGGTPIAAVELVEDITERLHIFQRMEEELDLNRKIIDVSPVGIAIFKASGKCVSVNEAAARMVGGSAEDLRRQNFREIGDWRSSGLLEAAEEALASGREARREVHLRTTFDREIWFEGRMVSFRSQGALHLLLIMVDLLEVRTAQARWEAALLEIAASRASAEVIENLMDPVALHDSEGRILKVNRAFREVFGYGDEIVGLLPEVLLGDGERSAARAALAACVRDGRLKNFRTTLLTKDGRELPFLLSATCQYDEAGRPKGMTVVAREISDLATALKEKEVLLREVYHRAKNNMQIISSLLNLQASRIDDPVLRDILKQNQSRIRTMALVHEKLYKSGDLSRIDFSTYARSLATQLLAAAGPCADRVALDLDLDDVVLNLNTAIPCGLILNELILNAFKHAFAGGRGGTLRVVLRGTGPGRYLLRVADDGVGFPEGLDFRRAQTMGLEIINTLAGQLDAAIDLDRSAGTAFTVVFADPAP
ncbi:MAG: PAS domain-containing protein [Candidatus Aminicenantes bacterium]|nr:PAS domain-containing protein [Candidatus Aminicenantes bacterium]